MAYTTDQYKGIIAETVAIQGYNDDEVHAYMAKPLGDGPFPGLILIPHALGWTEFHKELIHKFAYNGYLAVCPDIWCRAGHGEPEDVVAKVRSEGGLADDQVVGDAVGVADYIRGLSVSNGKVGLMGSCSGGRHTFLAACRTQGVFDAAVEGWGGNVVQPQERLTDAQPVSPFEYTKDLSCPLLGLFGNDDQNPPPADVDVHEQELKKFGKDYEFHRYDGAGHGFMYYHMPLYRQEQSMDGWSKVWEFLGRHLSS